MTRVLSLAAASGTVKLGRRQACVRAIHRFNSYDDRPLRVGWASVDMGIMVESSVDRASEDGYERR